MSVAVVGTGNIGSYVIKTLLGDLSITSVTAVTRKTSSSSSSNSDSTKLREVVVTDYKNDQDLDKALQGVQTLFLNKPFIPDDQQYTRAWVEASKRSKTVEHVLLISALAASDDSKAIPLLQMHRACEKEIEQSGLPFTHIRPAFFYTNFLRNAATVKGHNTVYSAWGDGKTFHVDPRDIADVVVAAIKNPNKYKNKSLSIAHPEMTSADEQAKAVSKVLEKTVNLVKIDDETLRNSLKNAPDFLVSHVSDLARSVREGHDDLPLDDLQAIIGRAPISFEQFIQENKNLFQ